MTFWYLLLFLVNNFGGLPDERVQKNVSMLHITHVFTDTNFTFFGHLQTYSSIKRRLVCVCRNSYRWNIIGRYSVHTFFFTSNECQKKKKTCICRNQLFFRGFKHYVIVPIDDYVVSEHITRSVSHLL